jgi:D-3-phosphoglycerate dehydrogenase
MKILVAEPIASSGVERLRAEGFEVDVKTSLSREELLEVIAGYDALIVRSATKADAELIDRGRELKVIGRAGTGVDNVDLDAATRHGILVVNAPQSNALSAAEHTMALLLAQARNIPSADSSLKSGRWERPEYEGVELNGKTLTILGLGRIGALVAQRALAFGMRVIAYDPYVSKPRAAQMGVELVSLEDALRQADFVSIHMARTPETENMIGSDQLRLMKRSARLVNASRGGIVDEEALASALEQGELAGAALDVFAREPLEPTAPILTAPNTVLTPHLGASTHEAQDKAGATIAEQVLLALRGDLAQYAVNVDAGREIAEAVRPFLPLAEKLGRIFTGIAGEATHRVRFAVLGQIADQDTRVVTLSALKGMLAAVVLEPVTFVNAPLLAAERGIEYSETKSPAARSYVNEFEIQGEGGIVVAGTVIGKNNEERITGVYDFEVEMPPGTYMAFLRYDDRPGVIGAIGTILGEAGVNIADMRVGRQTKGGEALMCLSVDTPVDAALLARLAEGSGAKAAVCLSLA